MRAAAVVVIGGRHLVVALDGKHEEAIVEEARTNVGKNVGVLDERAGADASPPRSKPFLHV
jgi:hypothetical protein